MKEAGKERDVEGYTERDSGK